MFVLWPVVQAVWIGFFERDLLTIDRQEWVGLDNYERMLWGEGLAWQISTMWLWRLLGLLLIIPVVNAYRRGSLSLGFTIAGVVGLVAVFGVLMGIHPGPDGRWNDSQFWPSFGNTLVFVLLSTPVIARVGLALALALNRPGRFIGLLRTLFFAPYVLSVAVLTLIWAFLLNPQLGLIDRCRRASSGRGRGTRVPARLAPRELTTPSLASTAATEPPRPRRAAQDRVARSAGHDRQARKQALRPADQPVVRSDTSDDPSGRSAHARYGAAQRRERSD